MKSKEINKKKLKKKPPKKPRKKDLRKKELKSIENNMLLSKSTIKRSIIKRRSITKNNKRNKIIQLENLMLKLQNLIQMIKTLKISENLLACLLKKQVLQKLKLLPKLQLQLLSLKKENLLVLEIFLSKCWKVMMILPLT